MTPFQTDSVQVQQEPFTNKTNAVSRACLFTLLVVSTDVDKGAHCQQLVQMIAKKFPCKIIFTVLDTFHPRNTLLMNRSIMTTVNNESISCDLLTIQASPDESTKLPFVILPEILADLPTFLLTAEAPFSLPSSFHMLYPYIHKTLFEINNVENYGQYAHSLIEYALKIPVVDFNWVRIEPWRITIARVFHTTQKIAHMHSLDKIEIRYMQRKKQDNQHAEVQAMLLQAWLATRLGWTIESVQMKEDKILIFYKTANNVSFSLHLQPSSSSFLEEGMVESIEMTSVDGYHFLMSYENDDRHIVVHSSSNDRCELPITFFVGSLHRGSTLASEMFQPSISSHYLPVLEHLKNPLWEKIEKKNRN